MTVTNTVPFKISLLFLVILGRIRADRCIDRNIPGVTTDKVRSLQENNKGREGERKKRGQKSQERKDQSEGKDRYFKQTSEVG